MRNLLTVNGERKPALRRGEKNQRPLCPDEERPPED